MKKYLSNVGFALTVMINALFGGRVHYGVCAELYHRWVMEGCRYGTRKYWSIQIIDKLFRGDLHCRKSWLYCQETAAHMRAYDVSNE